MLNTLRELISIPTVTTQEDILIDKLERLIPSEFQVWKKNIIIRGRSKHVFVAHYDTIGIVLEDYMGNGEYQYSTRGLFGKIGVERFYTIYQNREVIGVADGSKISLSVSEELPALYPMQFYPKLEMGKVQISAPYLDNKLSVSILLDLLKEADMNIILTAGEEQGTTRLEGIDRIFPDRDFISIDSTSAKNPMDERGISEIRYRAVEGAGTGNIAPRDLVDMIKKYISKEAISYSIHQISDATTLYRYGLRAINISYPVRYLHSPNEVIDLNTIQELREIIWRITQEP
ncbi:MAG: hypothetical protein NZ908_02410 [Candidatus Micrarchaeota archaeon]|nr:hypothetical protein [Candidatus Micrarchaeota archaeon]MCX8154724.1 hypothetical protein [Candidatus Micrarchaeota archaeon]